MSVPGTRDAQDAWVELRQSLGGRGVKHFWVLTFGGFGLLYSVDEEDSCR